MTREDPVRASLKALEATYPSSTATPTINTPSSSPSRVSQPSSRRGSPYRSNVASKSRASPPPRSPLASTAPPDFRQNQSDDSDVDEEDEDEMGESRPPFHRPTDGRSQVPLLKDERGRPSYESPNGSARPAFAARRSTFRSRSPELQAASNVRQKYTYAAFFLLVSLVSFVVQTETAVYIQHDLGWKKAYAMLYFTHGSWALLWPTQLLILRLIKWKTPWKTVWRRHVYILRSTAQMVKSGSLHLNSQEATDSPVAYMIRTAAIVTTSLTVAGGSWYVAVDLTSASDLTAIYNCSAFFAYAFSIPLLNDKFRLDKVLSVAVAIAGVLTVAYGDSGSAKSGSQSGGAANGGDKKDEEPQYRLVGNIIIGVGSVLYGLYEVLYKKLACPPEGTSPGRGMIFANTVGSLIGLFTLTVLWIPLPILHFLNLETFELPQGQAAYLLLISVLANATFSGSFLVLISLTSPVLSSVAALLTIFLVAIVDGIRTGEKLSRAAIIGGCMIIVAFALLSWSTYREMKQERLKHLEEDPVETSDDE